MTNIWGADYKMENILHENKSEVKDLRRNESVLKEKLKSDKTDGFHNVRKYLPKGNEFVNNNQLNMTFNQDIQTKDVTSFILGSKDLIIDENNLIKCDLLSTCKVPSTTEKTPNIAVKLGVKGVVPSDLKHNFKQEPLNSEITVAKHTVRMEKVQENGKKRNFEMSHNIIYTKSIVNFLKGVETRLDKVPKDILRKLGIVIEENDDIWRKSPEEIVVDIQNVEETTVEDDNEELELIIDEGSCDQNEDGVSSAELRDDTCTTFCDTLPVNNSDQHTISSTVSQQKNSNFQCNKCREIYPNSDSLAKHEGQHCHFHGCLDLIEDESEREKHYRVHISHPTKPFRCEFCQKRFRHYGYSKKHRNSCRNSKKSRCPYCKLSFSKISQYNKHIAKHMNKMICPDCSKSYIQIKKYSKHMIAQHNKQIIYQCTVCPRRFQMEDNIIRHIKIHNLRITDSGFSPYIVVEPLN